jgi:tRNA threonylcarbamoyladenosine biosynthesis protein TsaB
MITLALDACTYNGTVAVLQNNRVLAESDVAMRGKDEERLMPAVSEAIRRSGVRLAGIDRIVCGGGPGSFTSLRIAASLAKGMAFAAEKPLFAVSSLALIVAGNVALTPARASKRYLAALDAMRGECFIALFEHRSGTVVAIGGEGLVPVAAVAAVAASEQATVVGPDYGDRWGPVARGVLLLDADLLGRGPVNLSDWEPRYGRLAEAQAKWEAVHGALPR